MTKVLLKTALVASWSLIGVVEGFLMLKCLVVYPRVFADQFVFQNTVLIKVFISAVAGSMIFQALLAHVAPAAFEASIHHARNRFGYRRVISGLALVGIGIGVCGSGPTFIAPSVGAQVFDAVWLLAGALAAMTVVGIADRVTKGSSFSIAARPLPVQRHGTNDGTSRSELGQTRESSGAQSNGSTSASVAALEVHTVEKLLSKLLQRDVSYPLVAMSLGSIMMLACIGLELRFIYDVDVKQCGKVQRSVSSFEPCPAWPPTLLGVIIGLGQVPVRLIHRHGMGGSGPIMTMASTVTLDGLYPDAADGRLNSGAASWPILFNFCLLTLGSLLATHSLEDGEAEIVEHLRFSGFWRVQMFAGMFITILGSLIAGGCTCSHGVSGVSELALESWIGVPAMLATAVGTRYLLASYGV
eukprot:TRINITY_DN10475_c0_g1_i2.p1 TRINITY_DN10475_c0_g1~~TRINITY_DN10475_c0_g1_i2.p1  ORF type:complete len:486 (-),score=42.53 TRINITY_DN10475_c0_g1_i2:688-1929(-)